MYLCILSCIYFRCIDSIFSFQLNVLEVFLIYLLLTYGNYNYGLKNNVDFVAFDLMRNGKYEDYEGIWETFFRLI